MRKHFFALPIIATIFLSPQAQAEPPSPPKGSDQFYGELGYTPLNVRFFNGINAKPDVARMTLGWHVHQNLDVEVMGMSTLKKDKDIGLVMLGAYLKPRYSISEEMTIFAKIGASRIHLHSRAYGTSNRASYGIGIQKTFGENIYGQVDFTRYGIGKGREAVQGFTVSIGKSF